MLLAGFGGEGNTNTQNAWRIFFSVPGNNFRNNIYMGTRLKCNELLTTLSPLVPSDSIKAHCFSPSPLSCLLVWLGSVDENTH